MKLAALALLLSATSAPSRCKAATAVTFEAAPARAISNDVNLTEMMLVLGLRDRMVGYTGISGWKTLDEGRCARALRNCPSLSAKYPTKEVLVGAERTSSLRAGTTA
jgi:iron complex transport system substrate-binding protein